MGVVRGSVGVVRGSVGVVISIVSVQTTTRGQGEGGRKGGGAAQGVASN